MNPSTLRIQFAKARASAKRAKDAAESLGISEGQAIAAHTGEHDYPLKALPLRGDWMDILKGLQDCGPVLALTRNESTVHEKTGVYENLSMGAPVIGLAVGPAIDLRLFFMHWHAGFAVAEQPANAGAPASLSLQFFDAHGVAVHKVFCRDTTNRPAFEALVQRFAEPNLKHSFHAKPAAPVPAPDSDIDVDGFLQAWASMQDTHEFFDMLRTFGVERRQGLRMAEGRFTRRVSSTSIRSLLQEAAIDAAPIIVFVGNPGCIQIHTGPVVRVEPMEIQGTPWLNVLDPGFNLHLREDAIAHVWVVEKPTADGIVTSVEVFDHSGELMAMFFGERKPGQSEREDWRAIVRRAAPLAAETA